MMQVSPREVRRPSGLKRGTAVENTQNTEVVLEEALIEEVSIDGMCGVY
jgi:mycofactocin precursor